DLCPSALDCDCPGGYVTENSCGGSIATARVLHVDTACGSGEVCVFPDGLCGGSELTGSAIPEGMGYPGAPGKKAADTSGAGSPAGMGSRLQFWIDDIGFYRVN